ncbi:MAG: glycosyltransferase family 4 protein [Anaerolineaceae bacterium]|nr:glycosyltransferase family 4 protein [Anaerolineaceae bacterium]
MKLLFVAARWDPKNPDSGSGLDFNAYMALKDRVDEMKIVGPFKSNPTFPERVVRKLSEKILKKRLIKFYPSYLKESNAIVQNAMDTYKPDVIFSKSSVPLTNVNFSAPLVYMCDSSVKWVMDNWPIFSKFGLKIMERWEKAVILKAAHIITFSQANADVLENYYHIPPERITVHPVPSSLPHKEEDFQLKSLDKNQPLHLLMVGKEFHRKGVDIAIEATQLLNAKGIPTELRIAGQDGQNLENVTFMGLYKKEDPDQLVQYMDNYRWADFFLFPSRFDAAGIVPSEAAGFGVPTITNATGGIPTTVKDKVSGIVLEKHSPGSAYAKVIEHYRNHPDEYQALCKSTYARYKTELNWNALGNKLYSLMEELTQQK